MVSVCVLSFLLSSVVTFLSVAWKVFRMLFPAVVGPYARYCYCSWYSGFELETGDIHREV